MPFGWEMDKERILDGVVKTLHPKSTLISEGKIFSITQRLEEKAIFQGSLKNEALNPGTSLFILDFIGSGVWLFLRRFPSGAARLKEAVAA